MTLPDRNDVYPHRLFHWSDHNSPSIAQDEERVTPVRKQHHLVAHQHTLSLSSLLFYFKPSLTWFGQHYRLMISYHEKVIIDQFMLKHCGGCLSWYDCACALFNKWKYTAVRGFQFGVFWALLQIIITLHFRAQEKFLAKWHNLKLLLFSLPSISFKLWSSRDY